MGSMNQVVNIALQIQELVETVHQNKEDCKTIANRVKRLRAIVECLQNTDVSSEKTMMDEPKPLFNGEPAHSSFCISKPNKPSNTNPTHSPPKLQSREFSSVVVVIITEHDPFHSATEPAGEDAAGQVLRPARGLGEAQG